MKKSLLVASMLLSAYGAHAELISQLLAQGSKGIDALTNRYALQMNLTVDEAKQLSTTLQNTLKVLHNGQLPSSASTLSTLLSKDVVNQDVKNVSPARFFDMITSASQEANKMGMLGSENLVSCNYCISPKLREEGLTTLLSTTSVSGSARTYLSTKNYLQGARALGSKMGLSARDADAIITAKATENEKAQIVNALGLMADGNQAQRNLGATINSFSSDIKREILADTGLHTVVLKAEDAATINSMNSVLVKVKAMNPANGDDFAQKLGSYFKVALKDKPQDLETLKANNCFGLGTIISRAK